MHYILGEATDMIRQCTEYEKEILNNNREDILSETFETKHGIDIIPVFLGIILGGVIGFLIVIAIDLKGEYAIKGFVLICITIAIARVQFVFRRIGIGREKNKIFKYNQIEINGATILGVNHKDKCMIYVEDDFYDGQGRLQRISFPVRDCGMLQDGMRMIAVRTADGSYFLMRVNDETKNLIPAYCSVNLYDINAAQMLSQSIIPHPNAFYMDVYPRLLNQNEKELFLKNAGGFNAKNEKIGMTCFGIALGIIELFVFLILVGSDIITRSGSILILLAGLIAGGAALMILFRKLLRRQAGKRFEQDVYVQRVLFISHDLTVVGYVTQNCLKVYEYVNGVMTTQNYMYSNYNEKNSYGTVLYKYVCGKSIFFTSQMYKLG